MHRYPLDPKRRLVQFASALAANAHLTGFAEGRIYQGAVKQVCVPFLNCYSCPGALGACPVGSYQVMLAMPGHGVSMYVGGVVTTAGALGGRLVCGWLCPFGLLQEVLARPGARAVPIPRPLLWVKYLMLAAVLILPALWVSSVGMGAPYFCTYVCPAGTLEAGLLLAARDPALRALMGPLFFWKVAVLAAFLAAMLFVYRPFCRTVCPLGAFYGLLNPVSLWRIRHSADRCRHCRACRDACPVKLPVDQSPNHPECIRCLECVRVCPAQALTFTAGRPMPEVTVGARH
ncbi:MAG: 4Fe-4S binding protein [Candidatus Desulforudis sp.]|nr:4Fe-4S binding protein [Desulforudis sp.]